MTEGLGVGIEKTLPVQVQLRQSNLVRLEAHEGGDQKRFNMLAYSGAEVSLYGERAIFNVAQMEISSQRAPILRQHDPDRIAGFTQLIVKKNNQVLVEGVLCGSTEAGREVAALAAEGFPWQASIGLSDVLWKFIPQQETLMVNGKILEGPIYVADRSVLRESSFVPLGADAATNGVVLAGAALQREPGVTDEQLAIVAERRRALTLCAAFPQDADFVQKQIKIGATLAEAFAAYGSHAVELGRERAKNKKVTLKEGLAQIHAENPQLRETMRSAHIAEASEIYQTKRDLIKARLIRAKEIQAAKPGMPILTALRLADQELARR
jgi:hypothetical protein